MGDEQAVRLLLELGADPNAGDTHGRTALGALSSALSDPCCGQIAALLQQHGADCLLPVSYSSHSLVAYEVRQGRKNVAALMLAHLERQRAAGQLELGSVARAGHLLLACNHGGHWQLFNHTLRCLAAHLSAAGSPPPAADADLLREILTAAIEDSSDSSPASLEALLASGLPFNLAERGVSTLAAAEKSCPAAKVRLLHQAGAPRLSAEDLLYLVDKRSVQGIATLLAAGSPAVDTSRPALTVPGRRPEVPTTSYSCPIHGALLAKEVGLVCWASPGCRCPVPRHGMQAAGRAHHQLLSLTPPLLFPSGTPLPPHCTPPCRCLCPISCPPHHARHTRHCRWWRCFSRLATAPPCGATLRHPPFLSAAARCWRFLIPLIGTTHR